MSRELFGTDGVRGRAGEYPLDPVGTEQIGRAVGTHFVQESDTILLGADPRESSEEIVDGLRRGMVAVGATVEIVGVLPTPALAYLTRESAAAKAGVMVTASHNPYHDNGVKVFGPQGDKLPDGTEAELEFMIRNGVPDRRPGTWHRVENASGPYEDFLVASAEGTDFEGMVIGLDTANGAASGIADRVFMRLGAYTVPLFDKPDGRNINVACGATDTNALSQIVVERGLDFGVAVDGDADRLVMVDGLGRPFTGDHILYTLAVASHSNPNRGRPYEGVVATDMTNLGVELALQERGIILKRTKVGDRYVLEGLQQTDFRLGGEQSGHIIIPELLVTGDGQLAAIQTIRAVRESGMSLAEWRDQVTLVPQALVNIPVTDKSLLGHPDVQAYQAKLNDELGSQGRVLLRPSGTEPLARVMVEAPDASAAAHRAAAGLQQLLATLAE